MITALFLGTMHAFEADHLLAMSSIVTKKSKWKHAIYEGACWGMGHTSTIIIVGVLMILLKVAISERNFHYFEALVGLMLIGLGIYRIYRFFKRSKVLVHSHVHDHADRIIFPKPHSHLHVHINRVNNHNHAHLSYSIGMVHGLAGSGELVVAVAALYINPWLGLGYLALFGLGTVFGMMVATSILHIPFTQKAVFSQKISVYLVWLSAALCIGYGAKIVFHNLMLAGLIA